MEFQQIPWECHSKKEKKFESHQDLRPEATLALLLQGRHRASGEETWIFSLFNCPSIWKMVRSRPRENSACSPKLILLPIRAFAIPENSQSPSGMMVEVRTMKKENIQKCSRPESQRDGQVTNGDDNVVFRATIDLSQPLAIFTGEGKDSFLLVRGLKAYHQYGDIGDWDASIVSYKSVTSARYRWLPQFLLRRWLTVDRGC